MLKTLALGLIAAVLVATAGEARGAVVEAELTIAVGEVNFTGKTVEALTVSVEFPDRPSSSPRGRGPHSRPQRSRRPRLRTLARPAGSARPGRSSRHQLPGIAPHSVFTYEFPIRQAGTYWYHSHSGLQEQRGVYGSIVIHPRDGERHPADREQVVVLSDWTDENPEQVAGLLRSGNEWYAIERNTNQSLWGALRRNRLGDFLRREWESMPDNEISDIAYDRFLINGNTAPEFVAKPGETVRLRIINAASASYFYGAIRRGTDDGGGRGRKGRRAIRTR